MIKLNKVFIIFAIVMGVLVCNTFLTSFSQATEVQENIASESNVSSQSSPNLAITTSSNQVASSQNSVANESRTDGTVISSVNEVNVESAPSFGAAQVLDIILIAVGIVLILLAVAIIIRLK